MCDAYWHISYVNYSWPSFSIIFKPVIRAMKDFQDFQISIYGVSAHGPLQNLTRQILLYGCKTWPAWVGDERVLGSLNARAQKISVALVIDQEPSSAHATSHVALANRLSEEGGDKHDQSKFKAP